MLKFYISFLVCLLIKPTLSIAQITRGWQPGEIYLSSPWYYNEQNQLYSGIFYSKDNGRTLGLCYKSLENTGSMIPGKLLVDARLGTIYNIISNYLYRSFDYGKNWIETTLPGDIEEYATGCIEGEIYRMYYPNTFISNNYGYDFNLYIPNFSIALLEIGYNPGELYGIGWHGLTQFSFYHRTNYDSTFQSYVIDDITGGYYLQGNFPSLSHGNVNGEVYFISWHLPAIFKIFRSTDYGQHFNLQYTSDTCNFYFEGYDFTAGKAPGSFYIVKYDKRYWGDMTEVTIYYSSDSAKTFTPYVHHLDANWVDTAYNSISKPKTYFLNLNPVYPNPSNDYVTFNYNLGQTEQFATLEIYSLQGERLAQYKVYPQDKTLTVNISDIQPGIYLYQLKAKHFTSPTYKLIKN